MLYLIFGIIVAVIGLLILLDVGMNGTLIGVILLVLGAVQALAVMRNPTLRRSTGV